MMKIAEYNRFRIWILALCICCALQVFAYGTPLYVEEFYPVPTTAVYSTCVPLESTKNLLLDYQTEYLRNPKENKTYHSKQLFQIGHTADSQQRRRQVLWNNTLPSERQFYSTSIYIVAYREPLPAAEEALPPFITLRKAPPGGGQSTGEWLPISDAYVFLIVLAMMYGVTRRKHIVGKKS